VLLNLGAGEVPTATGVRWRGIWPPIFSVEWGPDKLSKRCDLKESTVSSSNPVVTSIRLTTRGGVTSLVRKRKRERYTILVTDSSRNVTFARGVLSQIDVPRSHVNFLTSS